MLFIHTGFLYSADDKKDDTKTEAQIKKEEADKKKTEEKRLKEEDAKKKKEEAAKKKIEEAKAKEEAAKKKAEEAATKKADLEKQKEEERLNKEQAKLEAQKAKDEAKRLKEEEALKKKLAKDEETFKKEQDKKEVALKKQKEKEEAKLKKEKEKDDAKLKAEEEKRKELEKKEAEIKEKQEKEKEADKLKREKAAEEQKKKKVEEDKKRKDEEEARILKEEEERKKREEEAKLKKDEEAMGKEKEKKAEKLKKEKEKEEKKLQAEEEKTRLAKEKEEARIRKEQAKKEGKERLEKEKEKQAELRDLEKQKRMSDERSAKLKVNEYKDNLKKDFTATLKQIKTANAELKDVYNIIDSFNAGIIRSLNKEQIDELKIKKDEFLLKKIAVERQLAELNIKATALKEEIKEIRKRKDNYIQADGTLNWEKTFDISNSAKFRKGTYNLSLKVKDDKNNWSDVEAINIKIDPKSDIPTLTVINPTENARVPSNLRVIGTAFDDDGIDRISLFVDDYPDEYECVGKEFWYYELDTRNMKDGNHQLKFIIYDVNGVRGKDYIVPFQLDRKTPVVSVESIVSGETVSGKLNLKGIASDGNGIRYIEYSIDDMLSFIRVPKVKNSNIEKTKFDWNVIIDSEILVDGAQTIWIKAVDGSGSEGYESLTVVVDHNIPKLAIDFPKERDKVNGAFIVSGYAEDNVGIKRLELEVKGPSASNMKETIKMLPGNPFWSKKLDFTDFNAGKYQMIATVEDISGNVATSVVNVDLDLASDKPTLELKTLNKKDNKFSSSIQLYGTVNDDDEVKEVSIKIMKDGVEEAVYEEKVFSKYSFSKDINLTDVNTFGEGKYTIDLIPIDINGIEGNKVTRTFSIERSSPKFDKNKLSEWAGKTFNGKISLPINVIKYGTLSSVKYSILNSNDYSKIVGLKDLKFRAGKNEGVYECDSIKEDFTSVNNDYQGGITLVKLIAKDEANNTSSIIIPIVIDPKKPEITLPEIDNAIGLVKNEKIVIDDNLLLSEVSLNISSSNKNFEPVIEESISHGFKQKYTLEVTNDEGKFNDYTFTINATDLAGNNMKSSLKVTFKETTEKTHTIEINIPRKNMSIYSKNAKVFVEKSTVGVDEIDSTLYGFSPDGFDNIKLKYGKKNNSPEVVNKENGIFVFRFTDEDRKGMKSGDVGVTVVKEAKKSVNIAKLTLFNDYNDPLGQVIWPPPFVPFNDDFTVYGKAFDDSGKVQVQYITDDDIPREIALADYNDNFLNKLSSDDDRRTIGAYYNKNKENYTLKKNLSGYDLLKICEILASSSYDIGIKTVKTSASTKDRVPLIDPLKKGQTTSLSNFISNNGIDMNKGDGIFRLNFPVKNLEDGEHVIYLKITDVAGKEIIKNSVFVVDKTKPEIDVWALKPFSGEELGAEKEKQEEAIKKENGDKTEAGAEEKEEVKKAEPERINGEITVRGFAKDDVKLSNVVVVYNGRNKIADGMSYWETFYDLNKLKGINLKAGQPVPHTIEIFAVDLAGNRTYFNKDILIDQEEDVPEIFINSPAIENQRFTEIVEIAGTARDDDGVEYIQYRIDYGNIGRRSKKKGAWERLDIIPGDVKWNKRLPEDFLPPGKHILEVQAVDIYGKKSDVKITNFHVDKENPEVQILSPPNGTYIKSDTIIIGRANDPNEVESVELSTNYGWSYVSAEGKDNWRYYFDSKSVPDGPVRVLIRTKDKAGSEGFSFALYNVDNTPPEIDILLPKDGMTVNNIYRIVGRADDNIGIGSVKISINTKLKGEDKDGYVNVEGKEAWYYDINTSNWDPRKTYHLIAKVKDLAGNVSETSLDFNVDSLSDLPVIVMDQPQPNQHVTGEVIDFFGTAADDEGIEGVYIKIDNKKEIKVKGTDTWTFTLPTVGLKQGPHKVVIYSREISTGGGKGKKSGPIMRVFYFDEGGPVINVKSHVNGAPVEHRPWIEGNVEYYEKDLELKLKKQIQEIKHLKTSRKYRRTPELIPDVENIEVSQFEVNALKAKFKMDNSIKSVFLSYDNGKTFSKNIVPLPNFKMRLQTQYLLNGPHMLQIKAIANNNKEMIKYFKVIVDRSIPEVIIADPIENSKVNDSIYVRGSANDNGVINDVQVALNKYDKNLRKVPQFVQGIYLWAQVLSGPLVSGGFGLTFFDDVVRLEGLFGWVPTKENVRDMGYNPETVGTGFFGATEDGRYAPRYSGFITGGKLLARIIDIPFEFFWGEDARNFSISLEIGCAFYWYSGFGGATRELSGQYYIEKRPDTVSGDPEYGYSAKDDGKVIAGFLYQIDFFKVEKYGPFRNFALYFENAFYFVASEIEGGLTIQVGFGLRNGFF